MRGVFDRSASSLARFADRLKATPTFARSSSSIIFFRVFIAPSRTQKFWSLSRVVIQYPCIDKQFINLIEIAPSRQESPEDNLFGHIVAALLYTDTYALYRDPAILQAQEYQLDLKAQIRQRGIILA